MSLLLKEVQVVDGTGKAPYKADVLIQKNIISAIGNLKSRGAARVIDGLGDYLTPGFIDLNTNSDHYLSLFTDPAQSDLTSQGVTTIFGGQCGSSLAPLIYGTLESIRKWIDPYEINVNWHTTAEFLKSLERVPLGINFGTLVGHSTIRRALVGDAKRRLTESELNVFKRLLRESLNQGAFGFSTGLGYVHGSAASNREIEELVKVVKEFDGVYATHLRHQGEKILDSVKEAIEIAERTGVRTIISHFRPEKGFSEQFEKAVEKIEATQAEIYFDVYPLPYSIETIYTLLPEWVRVGSLEMMLERVKNGGVTPLIKKDWPNFKGDEIEIVGAPNHEYLVGKSLARVAERLEVDPAEALIQVMKMTELRATILKRDIDLKVLPRALASSRAFIASNGNAVLPPGFVKPKESLSVFPKFLEIVLQSKLMTIESAVAKLTTEAIKFISPKRSLGRGVIKEGMAADLALVGKNNYSIKKVILGGELVDEVTANGQILRRR
ncbi:MAG: hypothetical protein HYS89_00660 [Candidatus Colwellbacteria bacterium]|nr:hypothetical protein [Candidatus Colwellbacteria bacterium]